MTLFYQRKDPGPVPPEPCARCHARLGTDWVDFMVPAGTEPRRPESGRPVARRLWLCEACRREVQRGAPGN